MSGFAVQPAGLDDTAGRLERIASTVGSISGAVRSAAPAHTGRPGTTAQLGELVADLQADLDGLGTAVAHEAAGLRRAGARYGGTDRAVVQVVR